MNAVIARFDRLSGPLLAALGLANALFFWTFLVVLLIALRAVPADAKECTGENILTELQRDDPARYADITKEAAATVNGDTLLFRIDRAGLEPSFLFGTMHLTDERVLSLPEKARAGFEAADTLALESTEILDPMKMQAALFSKPELTMFTDGTTLTSFLSADDAKLVEAELSRRGIPLALVSRMKPWMIAGMVAMPPCELARKANGVDFLDIKIANAAKAGG